MTNLVRFGHTIIDPRRLLAVKMFEKTEQTHATVELTFDTGAQVTMFDEAADEIIKGLSSAYTDETTRP